jgi:chromosome segregation ATPase
MDSPQLRSGLFGYSRKSVEAIMTERDMQMVQSVNDVREAEARVARLTGELETARRETSERRGQAERAESTVGQLRTELEDAKRARLEADLRLAELEGRIGSLQAELDEATEGSARSVRSLTEVLDATQRGVAELLEDARRRAEQELRANERAREALRGDIERLAAWRDSVAPLAEQVRRSVAEAREHTSELAGYLSELADVAPPAPDAAPEVIRLDEAASESEPAGRPTPWNRTGTGA